MDAPPLDELRVHARRGLGERLAQRTIIGERGLGVPREPRRTETA